MDLEDINPIAAIAGVIGGVIGYSIVGRIPELSFFWKMLTPLACAAASFFMVQKMAE